MRIVRPLLLFCFAVLASGADRTISQFVHTVWAAKDGAPAHIAAITQTKDGYLWLGSGQGLYRFDGVDFEQYEPTAGQPLPPRGVASLFAWPNGDLWVGFRDSGITEHVRYRYRLEGSDKNWQEAGTRRQAFYTNLGPGPYLFRVMACNNDGVWNEAGSTVSFRIMPAFYQTIWFQALGYAAGLALLWYLYRLRLQQATAQVHSRLEGRLAERERIARELHDTLLQSFQGLMLHLQAVDELLPPGKAKDRLEQGLDRADRAIAEGRSAVHNLRSAPGNDLAQALQGAADELVCEGSRPSA